MKKILLFLVLALGIFFSSCTENMPIIPCLTCDDDGGTTDPQDRVVLMEEFTGVRCSFCPAGSVEIENLLNQNPDRLIAVSMHVGYFANPYPENNYDFRTGEGDAIRNQLGIPTGYPSAVINRKLFNNEDDLQLGLASWGGYVVQEKTETAAVSLELEPDYDAGSGVLKLNVKGKAFEDVAGELRLSVMITESNIKDAQLLLSSSDPDPDYIHNHVLRGMMTNSDGEMVGNDLLINDTFEKELTMTLPNDWDTDNCNVVAFVHLTGGKQDVLQAAEAHIGN